MWTVPCITMWTGQSEAVVRALVMTDKRTYFLKIWNIFLRYIRHVLLSANKRPAIKGLISLDPSEASSKGI